MVVQEPDGPVERSIQPGQQVHAPVHRPIRSWCVTTYHPENGTEGRDPAPLTRGGWVGCQQRLRSLCTTNSPTSECLWSLYPPRLAFGGGTAAEHPMVGSSHPQLPEPPSLRQVGQPGSAPRRCPLGVRDLGPTLVLHTLTPMSSISPPPPPFPISTLFLRRLHPSGARSTAATASPSHRSVASLSTRAV